MIKLWKLLNGKKLVIASLYWQVVTPVLYVWYPNGMTGTTFKVYLTVGTILTGLGLGHKIIKKTFADREQE